MKDAKRFINAVSALILVTLMLFAFPPRTIRAAPSWWDSSWQYRMPINAIENSGVNLTNYQVPITLNTVSFDYSKAKANGDDVRFTSDGVECDYWIETWDPSGESRVWVEVPNIPAGGTATVYMYYGNPDATGTTNGEATFEFFDDFGDGTLDKWKYATGASVATDNTQPIQFGTYAMNLAHTGSGYIKCDTALMQNAAIRVLMKDMGTGSSGSPDADGVVGLRGSDSNAYDGILVEHDTDMGFHFDIGAAGIVPGDYITFNVWEWQEFAAYGITPSNHQAKHWLYGDTEPSSYSLSATSVSVTTAGLPFLRVASGQAHISVAMVRQWTSPEPTINLGEESEQAGADFSAQPTEGVAPLGVQFTDQSTGDYDSWLWEFGDGDTSDDANPRHTYSTPGTYTVSLTVSGPGGTDTETREDCITVYEGVNANFDAQPTMGEAPLTVQFRDRSDGDYDLRSWSFGDGETSHSRNPSHTYQNEGFYTVTLTVSGEGGRDTVTKRDLIIVEAQNLPARLVVQDLNISAVYAQPGQAIGITAKVANEGGSWGSDTVELLINGDFEQSVGVGVSPGTGQMVSFTVYRIEPGEYQVNIGNASGTFYIIEEPSKQTQSGGLLNLVGGLDTSGIIAIVCIGVIILGGIITIFLMTTRRA